MFCAKRARENDLLVVVCSFVYLLLFILFLTFIAVVVISLVVMIFDSVLLSTRLFVCFFLFIPNISVDILLIEGVRFSRLSMILVNFWEGIILRD